MDFVERTFAAEISPAGHISFILALSSCVSSKPTTVSGNRESKSGPKVCDDLTDGSFASGEGQSSK